ncbi:MAG: hypothetical protein KC656_34130 [Myxococcales bacterium]|nr:hypothetical protein [Myxococcales bacterium]
MLDAYIIDRIQKERSREQQRDGAFIPLHIEVPREEREPDLPPREEEQDRGSTQIDFRL